MDLKESATYIVFMVLLVLLSAMFSATETAFTSASKSRLKAMDSPKADKVLLLLEKYNDLLSTILIGNNVVNIGLASLGTVFFVSMLKSGGATVSTIVITIVVLIFGELTPKGIAKDMPEQVAIFMTPVMEILILELIVEFYLKIYLKTGFVPSAELKRVNLLKSSSYQEYYEIFLPLYSIP